MAISLGAGFFTVRAKDEATPEVERMAAGVRQRLGSIATQASYAMAAAGTAVLGFVAASVKAYEESAAAGAQLEAVIRSTGGAAGMTAEAVNDYANSVQAAGRAEGDAVVSASALMLTFTNIHRDVFPKAMDAVIDMSVAMKQDLNSSVIQVGKALNDPIQGITALTRVGVTFTEEQKDVIKSLVETGNVAEAQRLIIAELSKEFGGSAAAQAETFTGQLNKMKWEFGDMMENIGQAFIPVLRQLAEEFKKVMVPVADWVQANPEATASTVKWAAAASVLAVALVPLTRIGGALVTTFRGIGTVISWLWPLLIGLVEYIGLAMANALLLLAFSAYAVYKEWDGIVAGLKALWSDLITAFTAWVDDAATYIERSVDYVVQLVTRFFTDPIGAVFQYWSDLFGWFYGQIEKLEKMVLSAWETAKAAAGDIWNYVTGSGDYAKPEGGMATGGDVQRSGFYTIGETGPERLWLPKGAHISSASETRAMGNGGPVSVNVNFGDVQIGSEQDMDLLVGKMTRALERTISQRGLSLRTV